MVSMVTPLLSSISLVDGFFLWEIDEWDLNIPNIIPPQTYHFVASNHPTQSNINPIKHTSKTSRNISDMMAAFAILWVKFISS